MASSNREPICGFCWAEHKRVPLDFEHGIRMWHCPTCGRLTAPSEQEQQDLAQTEPEEPLAREAPGPIGWNGPPIAKRKGRGGRSGRKRKKPPYRPMPWDL